MKKRRVLVSGSRNFHNYDIFSTTMDEIEKKLNKKNKTIGTIIHGNAKGVDRMAGLWGRKNGLKVRSFPALWKLYGNGAGPIRNKQMLDEGRPHLVVAFLAADSRGTANMIKWSMEADVKVEIVNI